MRGHLFDYASSRVPVIDGRERLPHLGKSLVLAAMKKIRDVPFLPFTSIPTGAQPTLAQKNSKHTPQSLLSSFRFPPQRVRVCVWSYFLERERVCVRVKRTETRRVQARRRRCRLWSLPPIQQVSREIITTKTTVRIQNCWIETQT